MRFFRGLIRTAIPLSMLMWAGVVYAGTLVVEGVTVEYEQVSVSEAKDRCAVLTGSRVIACAWRLRGDPSRCWVILPTPVSFPILIHEIGYRCIAGHFT